MVVENILIVTIDSLRYDRSFGSKEATGCAPTLSALAASGYNFTEAFANGPNTPSSFPTILTGTYPLMYGGYRSLDEQRPFLSELLKNAGMQTVGYHSNPHLGPEKNYNHGFDTFNNGAEENHDAHTIKNFVDNHISSDSQLYRLLRRVWHYFNMATGTSAYTPATEITDRAINWFETEWDGESPYFMWLHYMDVHYPFTPPDQFLNEIGVEPSSTRRIADLNGRMQEDPESLTEQDRAELLNLYDGEIRYMDHSLERLLSKLESRGARENTAIVVTADHGEAFGEHGRYGHHPHNYEELVHVPLVIDVPGSGGHEVNQQVSLIDIPPTLCDLCGLKTPEAVQGKSLLPLMYGKERGDDVVICTASGGDMLASRTPEWKCLWDRKDNNVELYHLPNDPCEQHDVSSDNLQVVERFKNLLKDHAAEAYTTDTELPEVEETGEVKQRLEDLGYVD
jgi:arylsulfatase A-like enzyme